MTSIFLALVLLLINECLAAKPVKIKCGETGDVSAMKMEEKLGFQTPYYLRRKYRNNLDCNWTVKLGDTCTVMWINCDYRFRIEASCADCNADYLSVDHGKIVTKYCGRKRPAFNTSVGTLDFAFHSDETVRDRGLRCFARCVSKDPLLSTTTTPTTPTPPTPSTTTLTTTMTTTTTTTTTMPKRMMPKTMTPTTTMTTTMMPTTTKTTTLTTTMPPTTTPATTLTTTPTTKTPTTPTSTTTMAPTATKMKTTPTTTMPTTMMPTTTTTTTMLPTTTTMPTTPRTMQTTTPTPTPTLTPTTTTSPPTTPPLTTPLMTMPTTGRPTTMAPTTTPTTVTTTPMTTTMTTTTPTTTPTTKTPTTPTSTTTMPPTPTPMKTTPTTTMPTTMMPTMTTTTTTTTMLPTTTTMPKTPTTTQTTTPTPTLTPTTTTSPPTTPLPTTPLMTTPTTGRPSSSMVPTTTATTETTTPMTTTMSTTTMPTTAPTPTTTTPPSTREPTSLSTTAKPPCVCGKVNRAEAARIVGGVETEVNEYPWQAALVISGGNRPFCGGTLVHELWVLTAAHCTKNIAKEKIQVILGEHNWNVGGETDEFRYNVASLEEHDDYDPTNLDNDFTLIKLSKKVDYSDPKYDHIRPACWPTQDVPVGANGVATGWGRTSINGNQPFQLMEVTLPVITNMDCQAKFNPANPMNLVTANMVCAGDVINGGISTCTRDSGGPFVWQKLKSFEIQGVTSKDACGENKFPSVFARVKAVLPWMDMITGGDDSCPRNDEIPVTG